MARVARTESQEGPRVVGDVVMAPLDSVRPNDWNANEFTTDELEALRHGLRLDGWLKSQSLLIWGTDERGARRDIIIDGEHRWVVASDIGFKKGPMVFLDGLSEAEATALTIKLGNRRGKPDHTKLAPVVKAIQLKLSSTTLGLDLGFSADQMAKLLAPPPVANVGRTVSSNPHTKTVPLFLDPKTYAEFHELVKKLAKKFRTENVTDTVVAAVRAASK